MTSDFSGWREAIALLPEAKDLGLTMESPFIDYLIQMAGPRLQMGIVRGLLKCIEDMGSYQKGKPIVSPMTPHSLLIGEIYADKLLPWVRLLREKLFGSPETPFPSTSVMEEWIKHEEERERGRFKALDWKEMEEAVVHLGRFYNDGSFSVLPPERSLEYYGEDRKLKQVHISPPFPGFPLPVGEQWSDIQEYSPLSLLELETRLMARATGFEQADLVLYILTNIKPLLSRWQLTTCIDYQALLTGEKLKPHCLILEIKTDDLSLKELRQIYDHIRKQTIGKRVKTLNESHLKLYRLMKQKGEVPRRRKAIFWEQIRVEWNKKYPKKRFKTWQGVKAAWQRIEKKLPQAQVSIGN